MTMRIQSWQEAAQLSDAVSLAINYANILPHLNPPALLLLLLRLVIPILITTMRSCGGSQLNVMLLILCLQSA